MLSSTFSFDPESTATCNYFYHFGQHLCSKTNDTWLDETETHERTQCKYFNRLIGSKRTCFSPTLDITHESFFKVRFQRKYVSSRVCKQRRTGALERSSSIVLRRNLESLIWILLQAFFFRSFIPTLRFNNKIQTSYFFATFSRAKLYELLLLGFYIYC